jgi:hypothetical protein
MQLKDGHLYYIRKGTRYCALWAEEVAVPQERGSHHSRLSTAPRLVTEQSLSRLVMSDCAVYRRGRRHVP